MILTGNEIVKQVEAGRIRLDPFESRLATTNSYDLHLGDRMIRYTSDVLDPYEEPLYEEFLIPEEGVQMNPGDFLLGMTAERLGSDHYVPLIHARSGIARMGLFVHVTADLIDIGSYGCSTLQLYATLPVRLYRGMRIAQVTFWVPKGDVVLYNGKYQGSDGPRPSLTWKECQS